MTFLFLILLICFSCISCDNPTSIIPAYSGPDPGYIIAESTSGLGNRLRVMAAYMYIAQWKYDGAHLVFIWDITEACPGHFLSIFEPIPQVVFATNMSRYVLDKHAKINYENSFAVFSWIMKMNNIPKARYGLPSWSDIEYNMHSRYFPTREIMWKALSFISKYDICNASAMHIRETDMSQAVLKSSGGKKKFSIQAFINFVESRPNDEKIFLLTDNLQTQRYFLQHYPKQILIYSSMEISNPINQLPLQVRNMKDVEHLLVEKSENAKVKSISTKDSLPLQSNNSMPSDHRFTTLENAIIDVIIAAHAKTFKPSGFSSLSELVMMFNKIGKKDRGWCQ
jgi:hypothetical protein